MSVQEGAFGSGLLPKRMTTNSGIGFGSAEDRLNFPSVRLPGLANDGVLGIHAPIKRVGGVAHGKPVNLNTNLGQTIKRDLGHPIPAVGRRVQKWWNTLGMYLPGNSAAPAYGRKFRIPLGQPVLKANGKKFLVPTNIGISQIIHGDPSGPPSRGVASIDNQGIWNATISG
jgi:hypothetical protein